MIKAYLPAYLASAFPKLANLYERVTKRKIPYRNNAVILNNDMNESENCVTNSRFRFPVKNLLEQKSETA